MKVKNCITIEGNNVEITDWQYVILSRYHGDHNEQITTRWLLRSPISNCLNWLRYHDDQKITKRKSLISNYVNWLRYHDDYNSKYQQTCYYYFLNLVMFVICEVTKQPLKWGKTALFYITVTWEVSLFFLGRLTNEPVVCSINEKSLLRQSLPWRRQWGI